VVRKFFLHVSKNQQKQRFLERIDEPLKNWKFSSNDANERDYWDDYMKAYQEMIQELRRRKHRGMSSRRTTNGLPESSLRARFGDFGKHARSRFSGLLWIRLVANEVSVSETSSVAAEEIVWRGTSSQWKNFGVYLLCGLFCWLIVPIFFALVYYLQTKCKVFELTTQRLKITSGVFTKVTETLELYRVKDIETRQPFFSRLVGIENVQMTTSDASSPFVLIEAVPASVRFADKLRNQVEIIRQQKRVREIDID
jgi:membrane protein YdbS with pleckstrin-like domain